jgi:hypothetical protein
MLSASRTTVLMLCQSCLVAEPLLNAAMLPFSIARKVFRLSSSDMDAPAMACMTGLMLVFQIFLRVCFRMGACYINVQFFAISCCKIYLSAINYSLGNLFVEVAATQEIT